MRTHSDNLISILAGAAAGAVAMYLLDPKEGEKRRQQVGQFASDTLHSAEEQWQSLAHKAEDLAGQLSHHASVAADYGQRAVDQGSSQLSDYERQGHAAAQRYLKQARSAYQQASGRASTAADDASSTAHHYGSHLADAASSLAGQISSAGSRLFGTARQSAGEWQRRGSNAYAALRGEDRSGSVAVPVATTALGFLAVGAGAMYYFDPQKGAHRRAYLGQLCNDCLNETGHVFHLAGQYLRDQFRGVQKYGQDTLSHAQDTWHETSQTAKDRLSSAASSVGLAGTSPSSTGSAGASMPSSEGI